MKEFFSMKAIAEKVCRNLIILNKYLKLHCVIYVAVQDYQIEFKRRYYSIDSLIQWLNTALESDKLVLRPNSSTNELGDLKMVI